MKPRSIDENPFADLKLNLLQRKIVPSYNETLRACFTVVKSNFLKILHISLKFSKESGCLAVSFIAASCPVKNSTNVELSYYTKKRMQV